MSAGWCAGGRIDGYRLVRRLGAGGMGEVWLADELSTGAQRAIKTLFPGSNVEDVLRFCREGQGQAQVDEHPNVTRVHAAGEASGRPYLVMSLLEGGDLRERLKSGPLPIAEAVELVAALARGLAHVHAQGVLHRDIKPANVLFDQAGVPQLTDFGLAKIQGAESLTATGAILGTPSYMAPEQAEARREVGPQADVYSLGALLFHTLTGRPPFDGPSAVTVLTQVLARQAPDVRSLRPKVGARLAELCAQSLHKDPAARPQGAEAFAAALVNSLKPVRGPRWQLPAICGVVVVLVIGGWLATRANPAEQVPETPPPPRADQAETESPTPKPEPVALAWPESEWKKIETLTGVGYLREARWRVLRLANLDDLRAQLQAGLGLIDDRSRYHYDRRYGRLLLLRAGLAGERAALCALASRGKVDGGGRVAILAISLLNELERDDPTEAGQDVLAANSELLIGQGEGARKNVAYMVEQLAEDLREEQQRLWEANDDNSILTLAQRCHPAALRLYVRNQLRPDQRAEARLTLFLLHTAAQLGSANAAAQLAHLYMETQNLDVGSDIELRVGTTWGKHRPEPHLPFALACLGVATKAPSDRYQRYVVWLVESVGRAGMKLPATPHKELVRLSRELGF